MKPITYSLKSDQPNSEIYYKDVRSFTDESLIESSKTIFPIAEDFIQYLKTYKLEEIREKEEYTLELLSFGILWRSYAYKALKVKHAPFITLARMAEWRKKHQNIKPYIDFSRGILISLFLLPKNSINHTYQLPTLEEIDHVCKWFEATGEFREQALRFVRWRAFWGTKRKEELTKVFYAIQQFTNWFERRAKEKLNKYTENVEIFLKDSDKWYLWREDRIQCNRTLLEYHLNMVGAELMNRAFRAEFKETDAKVVLVPGCMRGKPANECEAKRVKEGLICNGCLSQCRVNQLRELGRKQNFKVYIIPHASDLSLWSPRPDRPKLGVIASACVTTLVEGGWELKRYDVPAQCVLLDYCGCKKHWDFNGEGIATALNVRELKRIINTN
jgi:uncharacterized protein